ncbi:GNAT family N-acetyltransferase [Ideonella sp.]|uniref:GNAT family N-acetyltransferase n=1 Tax=Ideonella sp. TaxID=1929293 RepID=UPI003BB512F0
MNATELAARAPQAWRSGRVMLRTPGPADAALLMDSFNASMPAFNYIHWTQAREGRPFTLDEAAAVAGRLQGYHQTGDSLHYLVQCADDTDAPGAVAGLIDLHSFDFATPRAEIGYTGDVRMAGRGLMTEAVVAVTQMAFSLGFVRVQALSDARNTSALRFAERLPGYQREGVLHAFERDPWGLLCAQVMFAAVAPGALPQPSNE